MPGARARRGLLPQLLAHQLRGGRFRWAVPRWCATARTEQQNQGEEGAYGRGHRRALAARLDAGLTPRAEIHH